MSRLAEIDVPAQLLAQARQGEEAARQALYASLGPAAFGIIRRLVGNHAQAEDLLQDTMLTFYEQLGRYRGEAPIGAWLRQIAVSKCLMYLRSPWHRARMEWARLEADPPVTRDPDPAVLDVERALVALSPVARTVVWLYEVEGYSHEEIARAFGRTNSFSKSQLARAHLRLRAWFDANTVKANGRMGKASCIPIF